MVSVLFSFVHKLHFRELNFMCMCGCCWYIHEGRMIGMLVQKEVVNL
jgi:hypothetical protein